MVVELLVASAFVSSHVDGPVRFQVRVPARSSRSVSYERACARRGGFGGLWFHRAGTNRRVTRGVNYAAGHGEAFVRNSRRFAVRASGNCWTD